MAFTRGHFKKILGWCPDAGSVRTQAFVPDEPHGIRSGRDYTERGRSPNLDRLTAPALVLLLPLLPAFIFISYTLAIPILLPSIEFQVAVKVLLIGIPVAILVHYGRSTHDVIGATLAGALLFPLFEIYSQVVGFLFDPGFILTSPVGWPELFVATSPFILLLGATGYLASGKTVRSLCCSLVPAILAIVIMLGIR